VIVPQMAPAQAWRGFAKAASADRASRELQ
jgi:hypothetical protein